MRDRYQIEKNEDWSKWTKQIPAINFKEDWNVKVIPPFAGAMVRFTVEKGGKHVSIYLDCNDSLGCVGSPYWELYPYEDDTYRCDIDEVDDLMNVISKVLD